jgi:hypothetical protein
MRVLYLRAMIFWHRYWVDYHLTHANQNRVLASTHLIRAQRHTWKRDRTCECLAEKGYYDGV